MFSPKFLGRSLKGWQPHKKKESCCFLFLIVDWLSIISWLGSMVIRSPLELWGLFEVPGKVAQFMCSMERGTVEHLKVTHPTVQSTYISFLSKHLLILAVWSHWPLCESCLGLRELHQVISLLWPCCCTFGSWCLDMPWEAGLYGLWVIKAHAQTYYYYVPTCTLSCTQQSYRGGILWCHLFCSFWSCIENIPHGIKSRCARNLAAISALISPRVELILIPSFGAIFWIHLCNWPQRCRYW